MKSHPEVFSTSIFPLLHLWMGIVFVLNVAHLLFFSYWGHSLYHLLSLAPHKADFWRWLSYPFVQPLFWEPVFTIYGACVLILFTWVGQVMLERMGVLRFLIYFFLFHLASAGLHLWLWPEKWLFGLGASLFGFMAVSWWFYPTLVVGDLIKLRSLIWLAMAAFGILSLILAHTQLDVYSTFFGIPLGALLFHGELLGNWTLRRLRLAWRRRQHKKRQTIRLRLDQVLIRIQELGGVDKLSREDRRFLHYASRFYQKSLRRQNPRSPESPSSEVRPPRREKLEES